MNKCSRWLLGGAIAFCMGYGSVAEAQTYAWDLSDEAAYATNGWQAGDNGGTNFGPWGFEYAGSDGSSNAFTIGDSTDLDPAVDINASGTSFRLTGLEGYAHAWRDMPSALETNQTFKMKFAAGVAAANKGIDIRAYGTSGSASFPSLFNMASRSSINGGTWYITTSAGQEFFSDGPDANTWFDVEVIQVTETPGFEQAYYRVTRNGAYSETLEGYFYGLIGNVKVYGSTGGSADTDAIYFNDMTVEEFAGSIPPPPEPPTNVTYIAWDWSSESAYDDGWQNADNGGLGFGAWGLSYTGSDGATNAFTIGDSTDLNPSVDINTNGTSFRLTGAETYAHAWRDFPATLETNEVFRMKLAAGVAASNKGLDLRARGGGINGTAMFTLASRSGTSAGKWYVNTSAGQHFFTDGPDANTWFDIEVVQVRTTPGYELAYYKVTRHGTYNETIDGFFTAEIGGLKVYGSSGGDADTDAIYFNTLVIDEFTGTLPPVPGLPTTDDYANDPAYSDGWTNGDNGGFGFKPWSFLLNGGTATIADSTTLGPDINTNGVSFKLYNGSGGYIQCLREFTESLAVGAKFTVSIAANGNGANKGFNVNAMGTSITSPNYLLHFRLGGSGAYFITEAGNPNITFSDPPSANSRFDCTFTQTDPTNFTYEIVRSGDYSETLSNTIPGTLGGFKFYGKMSGTTDPDGAIFFNNLRLLDPPPEGDPNLRITSFVMQGATAEIAFASEFGVTYYIQGTDNLAVGGWSNLATVVGTGPDNTNMVSAASAVQCYRIEKQD